MYDELVKALRNNADHYGYEGENGLVHLLTNAADAIEGLSKPCWIPVTERLPEESERVLVACEDGVSFGFFEEIIADDEFVKEWHDMMYYPISVTHWMPLPEPPKEET